jgi:hypothetical protein
MVLTLNQITRQTQCSPYRVNDKLGCGRTILFANLFAELFTKVIAKDLKCWDETGLETISEQNHSHLTGLFAGFCSLGLPQSSILGFVLSLLVR